MFQIIDSPRPHPRRRASRRRGGAFLMGASALVGVLSLGAGTAEAQTPCRQIVTADLTLTADLTCTLEVMASGVTVNLADHTLTGNIIGPSVRGVPAASDVRITGGTLVGSINFPSAADMRIDFMTIRSGGSWAVQVGDDAQIILNRFHDNRVAIDHFFGSGGIVAFNTFVNNAIGVSIQTGSNLTVWANTFRNNGRGVAFRDEDSHGAAGNAVLNNHFVNNRLGMTLTFRCDSAFSPRRVCTGAMRNNAVVGNTFENNAASGLLIEGACVIRPDVVLPEGAAPCSGQGTRIVQNRFVGNGYSPVNDVNTNPAHNDGLTFAGNPTSAGLVTVTGNTALRNAGLGIDAGGVIDGGRNRASGNGDTAHCLGVVCSG